MKNSKSIILRNVIGVIAVALLVLFDQVTKSLAVKYLKDKASYVLINGVLEFQYTENSGAAFGIFQNKQIGLVVISVIVLAFVIFLFETTPYKKRLTPMLVVYILIVAGAIGNMIDRIRLGYVVDFIYVRAINFPNFNVADSCVTVGCILLIVLLLFVYKEEEQITGIFKGKKNAAEIDTDVEDVNEVFSEDKGDSDRTVSEDVLKDTGDDE